MKKRLWILIFLIFSLSAFADNWTLGVMEFSFKQKQKLGESSAKAAQVLPQLIVEQFSSENIRTIPQKERLDRKLKELQTQRISLFLQLSKEYKSRDSLVLSTYSPKKLEKEIKKQMEKIRDIEIKINENLDEVKKEIDKAAPKISHDENAHSDLKNKDDKKNLPVFPIKLPFSFFQHDEKDEVITENVVLYRSDSTALFAPSEKSLEAGFTSWDFEQEVTSAKINGLITGEITCYGDYCSVTTHLRIYPGGEIFGSVQEVGLLTDLMPLADSIARNLDSKIANALPVMLDFDINPKEIAKDTKIMIDGIVFSLTKTDGSFDNKIIKDAGIHHINIEAPGYENLAFTYSFTDDNMFFVHANLVPKVHGQAHIKLKKYRDGVFHTYGLNQAPVSQEEPSAKLDVNGKSVLGVFSVPKKSQEDSDSSNIAFFRIPENQAFDGAYLLVNAKPFDRQANIDKRRRWMYTAYTALICSLPFTFYYKGEFTAENFANSQGRGDYDRLRDLQNRSNICAGISAACGAWTVIELVRYLWAADRVLPAKTKIDKKSMKEAAQLSKPQIEVIEDEAAESQESPEPESKESVIQNNEIMVN
ncbi:hypothetical protein DYE50_07525 [Treponema ruminis]|uniref:Gas vesicle protein n=1 Tax=Treponema ruminis TaxID=744515 RepID=A0A7W8G8M6_9SPIR|nr:hypothetical protein [Treponema ruminis]MBB5225726.1 gas vesicle protein [Treponema ruminis]QSI02416.1 hypothetical protein DYE50_07525 [Treponema ruminis]